MNTLYYGDNLNILRGNTNNECNPAFEAFKKAGKADKPGPKQADLGL